jgi:hypothetical protein
MTEHEHSDNRIEHLLKQSLPPTGDQPGAILQRDLWPAMQHRFDQHTVTLPWFDWALLAAVIAWFALFPKTILVLFYHL